MRRTLKRHQQQGAALAIALLMLVVIALLGVAAVRATRDELRLSQNAESRMAAVQGADSMVSFVSSGNNLPVDANGQFLSCIVASAVSSALFSCPSGFTPIATAGATYQLQQYGYAMVKRELPLFVEVTVLRDVELSAKNYDFARFTVTGGLDRTSESLSAAEITQGTLKLHTKVSGVNYE